MSLKNDPWAEYNAACFITNFLSFFLSLDKYHVLRVMDTQHRKELWRHHLPLEAVSMVPHPRLPAALIGEVPPSSRSYISLQAPWTADFSCWPWRSPPSH